MIQWLHARPRLVRNGSRVRAALATAALGPVLAGCALPGSGELPRAEPPRPLPQGCAPPSLAYVVSFLPPVDDRSKAALTEQFLAELRASELFGELVPGPGPAQVQLAVDMTQVATAPGSMILWYWLTATLIPLRVPFVYTLQAHVRLHRGEEKRYELSDQAGTWVWSPGFPPGLGDIVADVAGMDPASPSVRRNLYRTLLWRIREDLLRDPCPRARE